MCAPFSEITLKKGACRLQSRYANEGVRAHAQLQALCRWVVSDRESTLAYNIAADGCTKAKQQASHKIGRVFSLCATSIAHALRMRTHARALLLGTA